MKLWLPLAAVLALRAQEAAAPPAPDPYDVRAPREVVRFYSIASDTPDIGAATAALVELGARIVYGPQIAPRRKNASFVAVQAPASAADRELQKALRRAGGAARPLVCTVFGGLTPAFGAFDDDTLDEYLMWFETAAWIDGGGARVQMYFERPPSAKDAKAIVERVAMMSEQNVHLAPPLTETFTWELATAPDAARANRVLRAVRALDGVAGASLESVRLTVKVELLALAVSGVGGPLPAKEGRLDGKGRGAPNASWHTLPLNDLLVAEGLLAD